MKRKFTKPKTVIICVAVCFVLNLLVFGQQAAAPPDSAFKTTAEIIGYLTSFVTFIALVAGIVWYVFKGKNVERLKEDAAEWEKIANRRKAENADLKAEIIERETEIKELHESQEKLKKANLRLQGLNDN